MARNAKRRKASSTRILWVAFAIALIIVGVFVYESTTQGPRIALHITPWIVMAVANKASFVSYIVPDKPIGVPGGYMNTTQYLSDGLDGNYPIYTSNAQCVEPKYINQTLCLISVVSKVNRAYTLGDFFQVWGVPLGPDESVSTRYQSNSTFSWTMCVGNFNATAQTPITSDWHQYVLQNNQVMYLLFSDFGCA